MCDWWTQSGIQLWSERKIIHGLFFFYTESQESMSSTYVHKCESILCIAVTAASNFELGKTRHCKFICIAQLSNKVIKKNK